MRLLVDTNILLRLNNSNHPRHEQILNAVVQLLEQHTELFIVPQVVYEYWSVATRPVSANGLGMSPSEAKQSLEHLSLAVGMLYADESEIHEECLRLLRRYSITGKNVHDARLVAALQVHQLDGLVSADNDFARYQIKLINPLTVSE